MIKIEKQAEPREWTEYRLTPGADYEAKPFLAKSLLDEQGYICAYCMRRIPHCDKGSNESHRVEHIKCRDRYDDLKLVYSNMLICCPGNINGYWHCDKLKDNDDISFSPFDQNFIDSLGYKSHDDTIFSTNPVWDWELNKVLNLNNALLMQNRKSVLKGVISMLNRNRGKDGAWKKAGVKAVLDKWKVKHLERFKDEGECYVYYPYCGIVIWYLEKLYRRI